MHSLAHRTLEWAGPSDPPKLLLCSSSAGTSTPYHCCLWLQLVREVSVRQGWSCANPHSKCLARCPSWGERCRFDQGGHPRVCTLGLPGEAPGHGGGADAGGAAPARPRAPQAGRARHPRPLQPRVRARGGLSCAAHVRGLVLGLLHAPALLCVLALLRAVPRARQDPALALREAGRPRGHHALPGTPLHSLRWYPTALPWMPFCGPNCQDSMALHPMLASAPLF